LFCFAHNLHPIAAQIIACVEHRRFPLFHLGLARGNKKNLQIKKTCVFPT
jgi:hypothetical protein